MDTAALSVLVVAAAVIVAMWVARRAIPLPVAYFALMPFPISVGGEIASGNVSVSDVLGVMALVLLWVRRGSFNLGTIGRVIVTFLLAECLASLIASGLSDAALGLGRMGLVTLVPFLLFVNLGQTTAFCRQCFSTYVVGSALLGICSLGYFATQGFRGSMYTLGINKNALGPIFGTAVVLAFVAFLTDAYSGRARRINISLLAINAIGLLLCLSRGGWVGTIAGSLVAMACTRRAKPALIAIVIVAPLLVIMWRQLPTDATDYASNLSTDSYVLQTRFDGMQIAIDTFQQNPILGVGVGFRRRVEPHNVIIETMAESGIVGTVLFLAMVGAGAYTFIVAIRKSAPNSAMHNLAIAGLCAFVVYHVQTLIDVYWRRGVGAFSWAAVGMAWCIVQHLKATEDNQMLERRTRIRQKTMAAFG